MPLQYPEDSVILQETIDLLLQAWECYQPMSVFILRHIFIQK